METQGFGGKDGKTTFLSYLFSSALYRTKKGSYLIRLGKRGNKIAGYLIRLGKRGTKIGSYLFWFLLDRTKVHAYLIHLGKHGKKIGSYLFALGSLRANKNPLPFGSGFLFVALERQS